MYFCGKVLIAVKRGTLATNDALYSILKPRNIRIYNIWFVSRSLSEVRTPRDDKLKNYSSIFTGIYNDKYTKNLAITFCRGQKSSLRRSLHIRVYYLV